MTTTRVLCCFALFLTSFLSTSSFRAVWGALPVEFLNATGMEFRLIEPGVFMMGNDASVEELMSKYPGGQANSLATSTRRRATLTRPFYLSKRLTTVADFRRFVESTGYKTTAEQKGSGRGLSASGAWTDSPGLNWQEPGFAQTSKHPVVCVSYYDALAYVNWLNATAVEEPELGAVPHYILPTETQWEYAARAGSKSEYFWGDLPEDGANRLNAADEAGSALGYKWSFAFPFNDGYAATSPVGSFEPNAWGLYDMLGNVWEWCSDRFGTYPQNPAIDPQGALFGEYRVLRGGGWDAAPALARCAYRGANLPDACNTNYGFRVAFMLPDGAGTSSASSNSERVASEPIDPQQLNANPLNAPPVESSPSPSVSAPTPKVEPEPSSEYSEVENEVNPLKQRVANLGFAVMEGSRLLDNESVTRALDSIETSDYRAASNALKSGEPLDEILRKKIKMTALLASLGSSESKTSYPNFDLLPSVAKDRVMLLGSLAFLGLEFLTEDENPNDDKKTSEDVDDNDAP